MTRPSLPAHGGDLEWARRHFDIPESDWIDLSTGISPWSYPVEAIPPHVFQRLPYHTEGFMEAASQYYRCSDDQLVALPGSQSLIETLPYTLEKGTVHLPELGYSEHETHWRRAGHECLFYQSIADIHHAYTAREARKPIAQYAVLIHPNNPSTAQVDHQAFSELEARFASAKPNLLIVDEAFIDSFPNQSLLHTSSLTHTLFLRSLGKFFGLAGLRVGFAITDRARRDQIASLTGLWPISGPSMFIGEQALRDKVWIQQQGQRIATQSAQLTRCLTQHLPDCQIKSARLFTSVSGPDKTLTRCFLRLGYKGILTRLILTQGSTNILRFSLPGPHFERLTHALNETINHDI